MKTNQGNENQTLATQPIATGNVTLSVSPAPWSVKPYEYRKRGQSYSRPAAIIAADGHWVATEVCGHDFNGSAMANARLIAAAPDIYRTAQALLKQNRQHDHRRVQQGRRTGRT